MKLVFDIGMFDASDSRYYLESGCRVVAVEANPDLVTRARLEFDREIASGQLVIVNRAISDTPGEVELLLCAEDLGSSTLFRELIAHRAPPLSIRVATISLTELIAEHGTPTCVKIDIEGADRYCVLAIEPKHRPSFLSFEVGQDFDELLAHAETIGYSRFKLIGQCSFLELGNERSLGNRVRLRLLRWLGYSEPAWVRRSSRWFRLMHSSGPAPWESDGAWRSASALRRQWQTARAQKQTMGWYDVHATV